MNKFFYLGVAGIILFEFFKVYFIMPLPGSQAINSLDLAYFLHVNRWLFRAGFALMILYAIRPVFRSRWKILPVLSLLAAGAVVYMFNFKMTADRMFLQPQHLTSKPADENKIPGERLVIGLENNGEAKAYPISFIAYHHQVQDSIGGRPVMITYCSVCRTGRVFEPLVDGVPEQFRLVGMDHFNAMFEDKTTGSWWRQTTGQAVTGPLKGKALPELPALQLTVDKWFELYPDGLVMQADEASLEQYDSLAKYERGKSTGHLTRTDSLSWKNKSWVVGVHVDKSYKAYDWNMLKKERVINDMVGQKPIVVALSGDSQSFTAFERPSPENFTILRDTLYSGGKKYDFTGQDLGHPYHRLKRVMAYQEFWHSWMQFHPTTTKF